MSIIRRIINVCALLLCVIGCSKSAQTSENKDEYYVKYVFQYSKENIHSDKATAIFTFTDEHLNSQTRNYIGTGAKDEIICGPFKRGDRITASCVLTSSITYSYNIEIQVSKNNSPFALKGSGEIIDYIIDY